MQCVSVDLSAHHLTWKYKITESGMFFGFVYSSSIPKPCSCYVSYEQNPQKRQEDPYDECHVHWCGGTELVKVRWMCLPLETHC